MGSFLTSLNDALSSSPILAVAAAFVWGVLSMVLSPCHLVSIPLVFGCIMKSRGIDTGKAVPMKVAALFALGMTISIGVIGVVTNLLGRLAGDVGPLGEGLLAVILIVVGLSIAGLFQLPVPGLNKGGMGGGSPALLLGIVFGAALGPCTFAFMAPVLAVMFSLDSTAKALVLGLSFAVGHAGVVLLMGVFAGRIQRVVDWSGQSATARWLRIISGVLVSLGGIYLLVRLL